MPAEIQVHHEEILDLKESKVHLLYEIARAKSIGILRGGAPAPAKAKPASRVPQQPAASGEEPELAAQLGEMKKQLDAKDAAVKAREGEIAKLRLGTEGNASGGEAFEHTQLAIDKAVGVIQAEHVASMESLRLQHARDMDAKESKVKSLGDELEELRLQLREPSGAEPAPPLPPAAAMVDTFMAAMPPNPFAGAALTAGEEMQARRLFRVALAKQRKGWGLHEVLTEIDRATFIELIQNLAIAENEAVGAQQLPPPSAESIGAAFDKADADGSSTVSEAEFLRLFLEVKTGPAPSFLSSSFFGADGSGLDFDLNNWASGFVGKGGGD